MFISNFLKTIEKDKWMHMFVGVIIVLPQIIFFLKLDMLLEIISQICMYITLHVIGFSIEWIQSFNPNRTVDFNDYTATVTGGSCVIIIGSTIYFVIKHL